MIFKLKNNTHRITLKSKHGKVFVDKKGFCHLERGNHAGCTTIREDLLYILYKPFEDVLHG